MIIAVAAYSALSPLITHSQTGSHSVLRACRLEHGRSDVPILTDSLSGRVPEGAEKSDATQLVAKALE